MNKKDLERIKVDELLSTDYDYEWQCDWHDAILDYIDNRLFKNGSKDKDVVKEFALDFIDVLRAELMHIKKWKTAYSSEDRKQIEIELNVYEQLAAIAAE